MKFTEVRKLVKLVENSGIHELELEKDGVRIRVRKAEPNVIPIQQYSLPAAAPDQVAAPAASSQQPAAPTVEAVSKNYHDVKSPMVGTFYRAPAPDAEPYVEVGDRVTVGQTLCIVEAMKLMNEIEADAAGIVKEIVVDNAEPVEFGQVMLRIDPQG